MDLPIIRRLTKKKKEWKGDKKEKGSVALSKSHLSLLWHY